MPDSEQGMTIEDARVVIERRMAWAIAMAGGTVIPLAIILSAIFGGWAGAAGSFAGLGVASLNAAAAVWSLRRSLSLPVNRIPVSIFLMIWPRILVLSGLLYLLTRVDALEPVALLSSFLALFIAYTAVEAFVVWGAFNPHATCSDEEDH